jgi:aryl-alcohol dehydrogenase-like predicted oxidoreductase
MKHRVLGRTGMSVSDLALGAMNFVDTADVCSDGESEEILGGALTSRCEGVVRTTKFALQIGPDADHRGGSRSPLAQHIGLADARRTA